MTPPALLSSPGTVRYMTRLGLRVIHAWYLVLDRSFGVLLDD